MGAGNRGTSPMPGFCLRASPRTATTSSVTGLRCSLSGLLVLAPPPNDPSLDVNVRPPSCRTAPIRCSVSCAITSATRNRQSIVNDARSGASHSGLRQDHVGRVLLPGHLGASPRIRFEEEPALLASRLRSPGQYREFGCSSSVPGHSQFPSASSRTGRSRSRRSAARFSGVRASTRAASSLGRAASRLGANRAGASEDGVFLPLAGQDRALGTPGVSGDSKGRPSLRGVPSTTCRT